MLTSFVGGVVSGETILSSGFYFAERWRQLPSFVNIKLPQTTQKMNFRRDNDGGQRTEARTISLDSYLLLAPQIFFRQ